MFGELCSKADLAKFSGRLCGLSISLTLLNFAMCFGLQFLSTRPTSSTEWLRFSSETAFKVHQAFLSALCFTTVGINYHYLWPWSVWLLLAALFVSIMLFRSIDLCHTGRRLSALMIIALFCGASLVPLLDSVHPIPPSTIICFLWTMVVHFMFFQFLAYSLTPRDSHFFVFVMHLSGCTILVISYAASTIFGISKGVHFKMYFVIQICGDFLYSAFRNFITPRFDDEDRDEFVLHTFYMLISFLDVAIMIILFF